jgi:hypothetical protein
MLIMGGQLYLYMFKVGAHDGLDEEVRFFLACLFVET